MYKGWARYFVLEKDEKEYKPSALTAVMSNTRDYDPKIDKILQPATIKVTEKRLIVNNAVTKEFFDIPLSEINSVSGITKYQLRLFASFPTIKIGYGEGKTAAFYFAGYIDEKKDARRLISVFQKWLKMENPKAEFFIEPEDTSFTAKAKQYFWGPILLAILIIFFVIVLIDAFVIAPMYGQKEGVERMFLYYFTLEGFLELLFILGIVGSIIGLIYKYKNRKRK